MLRDRIDLIDRNISFLNNGFYDAYDMECINKLESYAVYCKEKEQYFWKRSCRSLINTRKDLDAEDFMYEYKVFKSSGEIIKKLSEKSSWDEIHQYIEENGLLYGDLLQDVSEMVLTYSKYGIDFIDKEVRRLYYVKDLPKIKNKYNNIKQQEKVKKYIKK